MKQISSPGKLLRFIDLCEIKGFLCGKNITRVGVNNVEFRSNNDTNGSG